MPSAPRIYRVDPFGQIITAQTPIAVIATLQWATSEPSDVQALAIAWTSTAVQIEWIWDGQTRTDWIAAAQVRRPDQPPREPRRDGDLPPRATRKRPRW